MRSTCPWQNPFTPSLSRNMVAMGAVFDPITMMVVGTVGSMGMNILGAANQSAAQRAAGDAAYQAALGRQNALEIEAKQREDAANAEQAASQRRAIEEKRKAGLVAGRAQAVMAASGAGVDSNIIAGILGEGEYSKGVALYEGDNRAQKQRYQAYLNRFEGQQGVTRGQYSKDVAGWQANNTLAMGIGKALFSGLSMAGKYGGDLPGTGVTATAPDVAMKAYGDAPDAWKYAGLDTGVGSGLGEIY